MHNLADAVDTDRRKRAVEHKEVDPEFEGQRVDNFLLACLKGVPRSHVYRLIRSGQVRVNSGRVAPSHRLRAGDRVRVPPVGRPGTAAAAPAAPEAVAWLADRIIYEDARLLVVDKPSGLAVHGGSGVNLGCIEALRVLRPELRSLELVHRLDRGTSGCLLVAKRRSVLRALHGVLREGRMEKRYLALVRGLWEHGDVEIDAPLAVRRGQGEAVVRVDEAGKAASSRFRRVDAFGTTASLAEVSIGTGRTHQIRVHAAHAGHPVAGDERYGDPVFNTAMEAYGLHRMFLHAAAVAFEWPDTAAPFAVSAPLPDELKDVLQALTGDRADRGRRRAGSPRPRSAGARSKRSDRRS